MNLSQAFLSQAGAVSGQMGLNAKIYLHLLFVFLAIHGHSMSYKSGLAQRTIQLKSSKSTSSKSCGVGFFSGDVFDNSHFGIVKYLNILNTSEIEDSANATR